MALVVLTYMGAVSKFCQYFCSCYISLLYTVSIETRVKRGVAVHKVSVDVAKRSMTEAQV